jgi:hypothetical protein
VSAAGRALSLQRTIVTPGDRTRFLDRARQLRAHFSAHDCRYWVFEEAELPGAFIEFTESGDVAALIAALTEAPEPVLDPGRIYREIAL